MNASELIARLNANQAQRLKLAAHAAAPGTGELRCAQLNEGIAVLLTEEAQLWASLAHGHVQLNGVPQSDVAVLLRRAAADAASLAAEWSGRRQDDAAKLRSAARQVRAEGEAAFADDGLVRVEGIGYVRR